MTKESLIKHLHKQKDTHGSWSKLARSLGVTPQYLQDIKDHRREPGPQFLSALGLVKVVSYHKAPRNVA